MTAGNLIAGLLALAYLLRLDRAAPLADPLLGKAAWLIFIGMFFDAADGRIARLTRTNSPFGAQLDSLSDIVTFGVAPALLGNAVLSATFPAMPSKIVFALVAVYAVGTALRLARYNVEAGHAEGSAVVHTFRGLPSPAAAGVVAGLVLLHGAYDLRGVEWALLAALPLLGFLMISRLPYPHVLNRYLDGRRPLAAIVVLVILLFLIVATFEITVAGGFLLFALWGPAAWGVGRILRGRQWADRLEDEDGNVGAEVGLEEGPTDDQGGPPRAGTLQTGIIPTGPLRASGGLGKDRP